jgi:hypothetical protein
MLTDGYHRMPQGLKHLELPLTGASAFVVLLRILEMIILMHPTQE